MSAMQYLYHELHITAHDWNQLPAEDRDDLFRWAREEMEREGWWWVAQTERRMADIPGKVWAA